jgi:prepilin-type N-terminal cleavage/methylation domain-containing protein
MDRRNMKQSGYTLIELMVAVGVIAVLSAIAIPLYNGYIQTSRIGALVNNIATIEVFEEDFRLRNGVYQDGEFDGGADAGLLALGWAPQEDDGTVYTIVLAGGSYQVTATDTAGTTVCRQYPEKIDCP